ncbi:MAG: hypothetical protein NW207_07320 [Cytophagales bacterium]|nr:hypothetical protein [Cytophagales bacterium]
MKTGNNNVIVLDPIQLIKKVKEKYGDNPIFPERIKEAKANQHLYHKMREQIKK